MTPRLSLVGRLAQSRLFGSFRYRVVIFGTVTAIFLVLTFFPQRHLASTSFTPTDRESLGLSGTLGQLGAINSVFGNQAAIEVAMRVGASVAVRDKVIVEAKLAKRLGGKDRLSLQRWLASRIDIRSLRGGIILVELQNRDEDLAKDIVAAYQVAMRDELAEISRKQTAYKREVLVKLVTDASDQMVKAQAAYDAFRLSNRYAEPRSSINAINDRIPALEVQIKAKQIQIETARALYTNNNLTLRQLLTELSALENQLRQAKSIAPQQEQSVGKLVQNSSELLRLERDLEIAKSLYYSYLRYLQGTAVEDLTSAANLRVLEEPHVETSRQLYLPALALAIASMLAWMAVELYRLRPPVGANLRQRGNYDN